MRILNDIHAGAIRSSGTTPSSQMALRQHILAEFQRLLPVNEDLMILGDLFDTNHVPLLDMFKVFEILSKWLAQNPLCKLYNVAGNHDLSKTSNIFSSFDFVGALLSEAYGARYVHITEPQVIPYGYVIPHLRNQDLFNHALEQVPQSEFLFLHCNYNNGFAAQSDQSLNLSEDQVRNIAASNIVIAHEHHARDIGRVHVPGNQIAASVSDWLGPDAKRYITVQLDGSFTYTEVVRKSVQFEDIDWQAAAASDKLFARVVGTADASESTKAVNAVNKVRKSSDCLVVSNAVQIDTRSETAAVSFEQVLTGVQSFNVMNALRNYLTPEQFTVVESQCSNN